VRIAVIRIAQDGTMQRRVVDTARFDDHLEWEHLAACRARLLDLAWAVLWVGIIAE
jgi:hypothetical protein